MKFKENVTRASERFMREITRESDVIRSGEEMGAFRVGLHVRRGDFLLPINVDYGLTVVNRKYLEEACRYFTTRHRRVQFVLATDDRSWTLSNLPEVSSNAEIVISNNTAAVDLAILSSCDAVIVSTGSFGWWGAWLANGTTVFYPDWPRNGSKFSQIFNRKNFFPSHWIPVS